jgi:cbb3-type cytochrome oxidase maturation protein
MNILILLVPVAFLLGLIFLGYFLWANHTGQFDDLQTPAFKILNEDEEYEKGDGDERSI